MKALTDVADEDKRLSAAVGEKQMPETVQHYCSSSAVHSREDDLCSLHFTHFPTVFLTSARLRSQTYSLNPKLAIGCPRALLWLCMAMGGKAKEIMPIQVGMAFRLFRCAWPPADSGSIASCLRRLSNPDSLQVVRRCLVILFQRPTISLTALSVS